MWGAVAVLFLIYSGSPGDLAGQEGKATIRFIDDSVRTGTIEEADETGIRFKTDGAAFAMKFTWEELAPEDARRLQAIRLGKPEVQAPTIKELTFPATRIKTQDNRTIVGIIVEVQSTPSEILIKNAKGRTFIPRANIVSQEPVPAPWHALYTNEEVAELLRKQVGNIDTPEQCREFGELLAKHGLTDRAQEQFFIARVLSNPGVPENKLYQDLIRLQRKLEDVTIGNMVAEARQLHLNNHYDEILACFDRIEERMVFSKIGSDLVQELKRLRAEVNALRELSRDHQMIAEWDRLTDAILMTRACDRGLGIADAVAFVRNQLTAHIARAVAAKFNIGPDDPTPVIVWQKRPATVHDKMSYGNATWLAEEPDRGNRDEWWSNADNTSRFRLLKGIYIEKEMHVIKVFEKTCSACGGSGVNAEWSARVGVTSFCRSCLGLKHERCLIYR